MTDEAPSVPVLHEAQDSWVPRPDAGQHAGKKRPASRPRPSIGRVLALVFTVLAVLAFAAGPCLFMAGGAR